MKLPQQDVSTSSRRQDVSTSSRRVAAGHKSDTPEGARLSILCSRLLGRTGALKSPSAVSSGPNGLGAPAFPLKPDASGRDES